MRVTQDSMVASTLDRLQTRLREHEAANEKVSTGRQWTTPSDDPAKANQALVLRADEHARAQQQRNAENADSRLEMTDSTLQSMVDRLHRVRDLTASAARDTMSVQERDAVATEIEEIGGELRGLANRTHAGKPLFAGYRDGDAVTFDGAAGEYVFRGSGDVIERVVGPHDSVRANVTAGELLADADLATEDDTLAMVDALAADVRADDSAAVSARLDDVDAALEQVQRHQSAVGVNHSRALTAIDRGARDLVAVKQERSSVEDVDLAEAIMDLQTQEVAFEAALGSLARVMQPSLLDFMR